MVIYKSINQFSSCSWIKCHTIYFFNNTIIVQVRYIIIETKEFDRTGYNGFLFPHEYSGARPSHEYSCGKRNPLYPIRAASFVSIVLYLIQTSL
jgi:hypothetical protein